MLKKVREHVARMWSGVALDIVGNEACDKMTVKGDEKFREIKD